MHSRDRLQIKPVFSKGWVVKGNPLPCNYFITIQLYIALGNLLLLRKSLWVFQCWRSTCKSSLLCSECRPVSAGVWTWKASSPSRTKGGQCDGNKWTWPAAQSWFAVGFQLWKKDTGKEANFSWCQIMATCPGHGTPLVRWEQRPALTLSSHLQLWSIFYLHAWGEVAVWKLLLHLEEGKRGGGSFYPAPSSPDYSTAAGIAASHTAEELSFLKIKLKLSLVHHPASCKSKAAGG